MSPSGIRKYNRRYAVLLLQAALSIGLGACANSPHEFARRHGMSDQVLPGTEYRHQVFLRSGNLDGRLHVYIEGDGRPWINGRMIAADPTPRDPLALRLMARDDVDSVYIGRPCYFGHANDPGCGPELWTSDRYSSEVAASLAAVANRLIREQGGKEVVLIGYSGGGALALLMAPRVSHLRGILTISANLDTDAWTSHHHFLPLTGSKNPALLATTPPPGVIHVQAIGTKDRNVPPFVTEQYASHRQTGMDVWVYPGYDHVCCWEPAWTDILSRFDTRLGYRPIKTPGSVPTDISEKATRVSDDST